MCGLASFSDTRILGIFGKGKTGPARPRARTQGWLGPNAADLSVVSRTSALQDGYRNPSSLHLGRVPFISFP
jgi:hypothetical protein